MKKSSKIIFTIVIMLLIVAIGVVGYFFVKNKKESDEKIGNLENEIVAIKENKTEYKVNENNSENANSASNKIINGNNLNETILSKSEALTLMKNSYDGILVDFYDNYDTVVKNFGEDGEYVTKEIDGGVYSAEVDDSYMKTLKSKFTNKGFSEFIEHTHIDEKNGRYYLQGEAGDMDPLYNSHSYNITSVTENKIIGRLIVNRDDDLDPIQYYDVILVKENGKWLLDNYEYEIADRA